MSTLIERVGLSIDRRSIVTVVVEQLGCPAMDRWIDRLMDRWFNGLIGPGGSSMDSPLWSGHSKFDMAVPYKNPVRLQEGGNQACLAGWNLMQCKKQVTNRVLTDPPTGTTWFLLSFRFTMASFLTATLQPPRLLFTHSGLYAATRALSVSATRRQAALSSFPNNNSIGDPSSASSCNTATPHPPSSSSSSSSPSPADASQVPPLRLSEEQRELLERMIRIDQAGELGANWIYRGQYAVLGSDKKVGPLLQVGANQLGYSTCEDT